jgi:hypothetical protein
MCVMCVCCLVCALFCDRLPPGSRPPAQLHAGLEGHSRVLAADGQELDAEEQQEIHKMFSEIHGSGERRSTREHHLSAA